VSKRWIHNVLAIAFALWPLGAIAYESDIHQQLTFVAAKQFSRCAQESDNIEHLSALDTRYVVRANVAQADSNVFTRMFRWNYYNRADEGNRTAVWLIDTRFHGHFDGLSATLADEDKRQQRLRTFGRILSYVQDVTSPAHVVPVFTTRWWRLSFGDRFDRFPVDAVAVEARLEGVCEELADLAPSFDTILSAAAADTIRGVQSKIEGFPTTWESYWEFADAPDDFGEYGPAGNQFGSRTQFPCGNRERCLLLEDDPLYHAFAVDRHVAAVRATLQAMMVMQALENHRSSTNPLPLLAD
jgi:hypothetical protein